MKNVKFRGKKTKSRGNSAAQNSAGKNSAAQNSAENPNPAKFRGRRKTVGPNDDYNEPLTTLFSQLVDITKSKRKDRPFNMHW